MSSRGFEYFKVPKGGLNFFKHVKGDCNIFLVAYQIFRTSTSIKCLLPKTEVCENQNRPGIICECFIIVDPGLDHGHRLV